MIKLLIQEVDSMLIFFANVILLHILYVTFNYLQS
jgi:hypothetical protein